eukprot:TRINITY_DN29469_c0_g1_i2.p2 TRINITY_DN29469_c0_g1~~TRINITY_DN29469_c0_g1_i2.p2  ORF type:complete len:123 (+),score=19.06 TRINITY_DN29469_c0_g1_i2:143-511(+)
MIEAFYIFTTGGPVLWSIQLTKITGDPVNALIRQVLVDEDEGRKDAIWVEPYYMRWRLLRQAELCFVVAYQGLMQRAYLERVLEGMIERVQASCRNACLCRYTEGQDCAEQESARAVSAIGG